MDRLEAMTVFRTVVAEGSLSAAGRKLGMPLATVSRKLSDLEAHLGARLLTRSTRKLALTDAGAAYLEACERILDEVDEAERGAAGEFVAPRGELVITAPLAFGRMHVVPVLAEFLQAYPDIDARLVLGDRNVNLIDEQMDLAIRIGELPDSNLVASRVGATRPVICASQAYLQEHGRPSSVAELMEHAVIGFDALMQAEAWRFGTGKMVVRVPVKPRLMVNTAEAAIAAAVAGAGLTRALCYQVAEALKSGALEVVLAEHEPAPWPIHLVYLRQGRLPLKVRAFLDFAAPRLRARMG